MSVCDWLASVLPGVKATSMLCPAFFAASSIAAQPPKTMISAIDTCLLPDCEELNEC
jgi:hypothetical protein